MGLLVSKNSHIVKRRTWRYWYRTIALPLCYT